MPRALKVYRTPIGFHDAYVAAPSQKAALAAWGADANLFARGAAEQVTDPALMKDALADPGKVIKRPRASMEEHFASLGRQQAEKRTPGRQPRRKSRAKPPPRPSREALDAAEQALAEQRAQGRAQRAALEEERDRIIARIDDMQRRLQKAEDGLVRKVEQERKRHDAALKRWRSS
jgi:hypothetical protein